MSGNSPQRRKGPLSPTKSPQKSSSPTKGGSQEDRRRGMPPLSPSKHYGGAGWGGDPNRDGWLVNKTQRGYDGGTTYPPAPVNYLPKNRGMMEEDEDGEVSKAVSQAANRTPAKGGPTSKRDRAYAMSRMLRALLNELDEEFTERREEWGRISQDLGGKVLRLQDAIRTAQRVTCDTVNGNAEILREVMKRSTFCAWDVAICTQKQKKRVLQNITWWMNGRSQVINEANQKKVEEQKEWKMIETYFTALKMYHDRLRRGAAIEQMSDPRTDQQKAFDKKNAPPENEDPPKDISSRVVPFPKTPKMGMAKLRAHHEGHDLTLRWAFVGWRLTKLMANACCQGLGAAIATGPNAPRLRKMVAKAWLHLARLKLARLQLVKGIKARRAHATKHRILYAWQITVVTEQNQVQKATFVAQVRNGSKWVVTCFHLWARRAWSESKEKQVAARVQACTELAEKQRDIWTLRVAELENAIQEAKRCRIVQKELAVENRNAKFPDWKPTGHSTAFFRPPSGFPGSR